MTRMKSATQQTPATSDPATNANANTNSSDYTELNALPIDQLLHRLHQLLLQCQCLGDQKMKLTAQIMETLGAKTRQLINWGQVEAKTQESAEKLMQIMELDEKKIVSDFKVAIKHHGSISHHYSAANSSNAQNSGSGRSSSRFSTCANPPPPPSAPPSSAAKSAAGKAASGPLNSLSKYNLTSNRKAANSAHSAAVSVAPRSNLDTLIDAYSFDDQTAALQVNQASSPFSIGSSKCYRNGINNDKLLRNSNMHSINYNTNTSSGGGHLNSNSKKKTATVNHTTNTGGSSSAKSSSDVNNNTSSGGMKRSLKKLKVENAGSPNHAEASSNPTTVIKRGYCSYIIILCYTLFSKIP